MTARPSGEPEAAAVHVPRLLLLTDRRSLPASRDLEDAVSAALTGGVDGVVLRERDLEPADRAACGSRLRAVATAHDAAFIWAEPPAGALGKADGIHLRADSPLPPARPTLLGRSCHTVDELRRAAADGCDYVTLSPVAPTSSKPGYGPPLGSSGVAAALHAAGYDESSPLVLALGGVTAGQIPELLDAGVHGVAVMGSLLRHDDVGAAATSYAAALRAAVLDVAPR